MSNCPGATLEAFLMWIYDLIVDGDGSANPSLQIAEAIGTATNHRKQMTAEQFAPIVSLFEPYREKTEWTLVDYNEEDNGSWRDFAGYAFDFIPRQLYEQGSMLISRCR